MKIISLKDVEKKKVSMEGAEKAYKQVPLSRTDGAPLYAYRVFTIEPGVIPLITDILTNT